MEMPTPCERCGHLFDLLDGKESPRTATLIICASCANSEQEEVNREEEVDSLRDAIMEAEDVIRNARSRLGLLGAPII